MLDLTGDDVIAFVAQREERALEGQVVGLAAAARKNDLIVVTAQQCCDLGTSGFDGSLCLDRGPMPLDGLP